MEVSLLTHPEPPVTRLETFAAKTDSRDLQWGRFLKLQPRPNGSTARAESLLKEGLDLLRENRRKDPAKPDKMTDLTTTTDPPVKPDRPRPPEFDPINRSVAAIRAVKVIDELKPVIGTVSLTIRTPAKSAERLLLNGETPVPAFPLVPSEQATPVDGLTIPANFSLATAWSWPAGTLGEVGFWPLSQSPGARRLVTAGVFLPTVVLVEGALKNLTVNDEFLLAGDLNPDTLAPSLPGGVIETLTVASTSGRKYLLVPASVKDELVELLLKSNQLEILFSPELISYTTPEEVVSRVFSPTAPSITEASTIFAEIKAVSERMPLPDLARNAKVQERLESILASCPDHLSARVMLEFGRRPITAEMRLLQLSGKIDAVVMPFLTMDEAETNQSLLKEQVEAAQLSLSRLRTDIPLEGREFLSAAEDLVDAVEEYLSLTNKDTSIAIQRKREMTEAIATYTSRRILVGLTPLEEEEEEEQ
jgi:hypothetical protein